MNTPTTVGLYVAGLALTFGVAYGVGAAVGPLGAPGPTMSDSDMSDMSEES